MEPILNFCSDNPGLTFLILYFGYLMVDSVAGIFKKERTEKKDENGENMELNHMISEVINQGYTPEFFTDDEIKLARDRENDKFGVEVSEDKSKIKVFPKDEDSLDDPLLLTVERHIKFPEYRIWHMELLTDIHIIGTDPHNDPNNHVRWAEIPLSAMLDKMFGLFEGEINVVYGVSK